MDKRPHTQTDRKIKAVTLKTVKYFATKTFDHCCSQGWLVFPLEEETGTVSAGLPSLSSVAFSKVAKTLGVMRSTHLTSC